MQKRKLKDKSISEIEDIELLNSMSENSPFLILRNKPDATITFINKAIEKFFNIKRENIIGNKWLSNLSNKQKSEIKENLKRASENLETFYHTVSYKLENNEEKIIKWYTSPLVDENGKFLGELVAYGIDITEKHIVKNQLDNVKEQLNFFFMQSLDGFFFMETNEPIEWNDKCNKNKSIRNFYHNFKISKVNKAFLDQYKAKEDQIIGLSPADFFVHNYNQGLNLCQKVLDAGYITLTTEERKLDGTLMWIEAQYSLIKDEKGFITGLFGIQREITEKVKLENELRENESIFRNSYENNPHPMWIYDINTTKILSVNKAAIDFFGYSKEEFLKMSLIDLGREEDHKELENIINDVRKNPTDFRLHTWKQIKKNGDVVDFEIRANYIKFKDKDARIVVGTDITEKLKNQQRIKESEESYKGLFDSISEALYILDENSHFITVNAGAEKMYGYKREEFVGKTPEFLSAPGRNDFDQVLNFLNETYKTGKLNKFEFWGLRKNGEIFPKDVTINKAKYFGKDVIIAVGRDISERKNFEVSLELSNENFKSIFNQLHEAIIIHDFDGNILEVNKKASQLYGYSLDEFRRVSVYDISSNINMQNFRLRKIWQKVKTGNNISFEWVAKKKNGEQFEVAVSLQKNIWSGNDVIFANVKDISSEKKIEKALQDSEESYVGLFNSVTDFIFILNYDGIVLDVNNAVLKSLGFDKDKIINHSISLISVPLKNNFTEVLERISHTYYTAKPSSIEFWMHNIKGDEILTDIKLTHSKYGEKNVVIALARDITEKEKYQKHLIESEERFRNLYENASIGIFRSTINGDIIFANPALVKIFGYDSFDEFKDIKVQDLFYVDKNQRNTFIKMLIDNNQLNGVEYDLFKKDRSIITVRENSRLIKNEKGDFEYIEGTIEDITEKKKSEIALKQSETYLKELNATKDKFFSIIAHDLRSPFQGLLGIASIIDQEEMEQQEKDFYFHRLYEGIKNLYTLIEELLTWSRVQRGVLEFYPEKNNLRFDIEDVLTVMKDIATKKDIIIIDELEENLICFYDKYMIDTVLRNLISNAIKFTPTLGNISVTANKKNNEIIVTVKDSGIGISKEDIQKIFRLDTPFTRRGTNDEPGTGLGLILCQEFIKKHNGKLWIESEVNKGSTFSFSLPLNLNE